MQAKENPWYQLATLAGTEKEDHSENLIYWNGYQRYLLEKIGKFDPEDPDMAGLPQLSHEELAKIAAIEGLPSQLVEGDDIDFRKCVFEYSVDFQNFYFGFEVWFGDTEFQASAIFDGAKFREEAGFLGARFQNYADFGGVKFC